MSFVIMLMLIIIIIIIVRIITKCAGCAVVDLRVCKIGCQWFNGRWCAPNRTGQVWLIEEHGRIPVSLHGGPLMSSSPQDEY